MFSSPADATAGLGLDPEYLQFRQSISSSAELSAVTVSCNFKLDNVEVLKLSDGYKLWSQKMSVIFKAMGLYKIVVSGIDSSPLASTEELITFQLAQRQGFLVIIQIVSNKIFGDIAKLKTPHDKWIYLWTAYRCNSTISYVFALRSFMCIEQGISPAQVSPSDCISAFETEWNQIAHLSQTSAASSSTDQKIVKDLFTCQEAKTDFLLGWVPKSHDNVVENLSSKDHLTIHEAKDGSLNPASNYRSPSGASSKNSKPQYEANAISSSNGKKDKKKKQGNRSSSNSSGKECNWCRKYSRGNASRHIWTQCKELKARRDRNGAETAAPVQEVANTVSSNSSKWFFDTGASSHMTPDRNYFKSFSSARGNVVLADTTQVEYIGVGSVRYLCRLPSGDISVVLLCRVLFVPSLRKYLYSWNSVKSIGKFALIDDGVFQVVRNVDRSVIINTFQSGNDVVLELILSESASLADDTDYDFWHAALGHPFKANMHRKLYEDGYQIPDCPSAFTCNPCALSKSKHKVPKPVESNSTELFELLHSDVCGPFPNEAYGGSK
jgi:hypothetical protein